MANVSEEIEEEFLLAQQLKDAYCDKFGKETNPAKAAEIIHKIGVIYRKRSPDKISLIKSVGLLNAAIVRNPSNIAQVKIDLIEICQHILHKSKAINQNVDLIKKAIHVKTAIEKLRSKVNAMLESSVPKIPANITREKFQKLASNKILAIQQVNKTIADKYKLIMAGLSKFCEDLMGKPPCEYAIVGMGSLAREEITPYSDFEHIIILFDSTNYKSHLEYFKWFSVIFHVVILNVQESIIPSLNVFSLNDKDSKLKDWFYDAITPRGVSFDGMMPHACKFPLGRQQYTKKKQFSTELIKPVSEMLQYLSSEADLKNGYHLSDILTKTCFVYGNKNIFNQFLDGAKLYRHNKSKIETIKDVQQQVKDDLNNFSTRFRLTGLKSQKTINIKQFVYRSTTIFIAALGRIHNISANSCFDIISEMVKNNKMTQNTADKLRFAIAIACEMRLRVYMRKKSQCDNAIDLRNNGIQQFLDIVGMASTINYFQIAYCLQCEIAKQLDFTKLHFYCNAQLINVTIGLAFGLSEFASFQNQQSPIWDSSKFDFDVCIEQLETKIKLSSKSGLFQRFGGKVFKIFTTPTIHTSSQVSLNEKQLETIAQNLYSEEIYDEALEFYKQLLEIYQRQSINNSRSYDIAMASNWVGICLKQSKQPSNALNHLNRALEIEENITSNANKDISIAATLHNIGWCHIDLSNYEKALTYLNRALEIMNNISLNPEKDWNIATTLNEIGRCHMYLYNYNDALTYLNRALTIKQNRTLNAETDRDIAMTLNRIGCCHVHSNNYNDALTYLNSALKVIENTSSNAKTDRSIANELHEIGFCHIYMDNYKEALLCLQRALEISYNVTLNAEEDRTIATTMHNIGRCLIDLHNYNDALKYINGAFAIESRIGIGQNKDHSLALTQCNIGRCLTGLKQYDDSWNCLEKTLNYYRNTTKDKEKDAYYPYTLNSIGECLMGKQLFGDALKYLHQAQTVYQQTLIKPRLAKTLHNIGICFLNLQEYTDALNYFKQSLRIYEKLTLNEYITTKIESNRTKIDQCLAKLN